MQKVSSIFKIDAAAIIYRMQIGNKILKKFTSFFAMQINFLE